jgi:hypothetical protein
MNLREEILSVLGKGDYCRVGKISRGFEIEYGSMYSAPELGLKTLIALSEIFGTKAIDVDNYGTSGCDTCDYGSDYGHTIQIYEPTKNLKEMKKLIGKDLVSN